MSFNGYMAAVDYLEPLDEAYHGRSKIKPIQTAMDAIYKKVTIDPKWKVQGSKEAKDLEKAFCKVFGFNRCSIYWRYVDIPMNVMVTIPDINVNNPRDPENPYNIPSHEYTPNSGPYTVPASVYIPSLVEKNRQTEKDNYDVNHSMNVFITTDQTLFTGVLKATSEEMVAILLHEVGHNFDCTIFRAIKSWFPWLEMLVKFTNLCVKNKLDPATVWEQVRSTVKIQTISILTRDVVSRVMPELVGIFTNMEDIILSAIVPLAKKLKPILVVAGKVWNDLLGALTPVFGAVEFFKEFKKLPVNYVVNTLDRKAETYADSFATQYGYGPELGAYNARFEQLITLQSYGGNNRYLAPIYDLTEIMSNVLLMGDAHETTAKRFQRSVRTLKYDLAASDLTAEDKKLIEAELKRVQKTYNDYINMPDDGKHFVYTAYRKTVDMWIKSDVYEFVDKFRLLPSETYAK